MNDFSSSVADLSPERRELLERLLRQENVASPPGILPQNGDGDVPLSFAQELLWFLDQLGPGNPAYNIAGTVRFGGTLDPVALGQALRALVCRHNTLRTTFIARAGQPAQVVIPTLPLAVPLVDLRDFPEVERESRAWELAVAEARKPFDLASGPLLRTSLLRLADDEHLLLLTVHHIAADGWSMRLLVRELAEAYEAFAAGHEVLLPELPAQYADHAIWQRQSLQGKVLEEQLSYWKKRLAGASQVLTLPTDHPRPTTQAYCGARHSFRLPARLAEAVRALGRQYGCTPFMVLLAAFQALLSRYSGQDDLCVGSSIAGRDRPEVKGLVGFFVNTLVLRADLTGNPSFGELLGRIRETCLDAYAHQELPFERLVEELHPQRDLSRSPLFQVLFSFDLEPETRLELPGLTLEFSEVDTRTAKFDLSLYIREGAAGLGGYLEYDTDLFEGETAAQMIGHWQTLLQAAIADPSLHLGELPLLTEAERRRLLLEWNDTRAPLPPQQCLHQLIEAQVERTPDAIALVHGEERLSYQELNRRANRLAHRLRAQGVGPNQLVGVCLERSSEMVVALLGILKAGGAYLPLDPSHPAERVAFILEDARVGLVVTQRHFAERFSSVGACTICVDADAPAIARAKDSNLGSGDGHHLAYVLYTSGSTGRPKGVAIEHHSAAVFVDWVRSTLSPEELAGVLAGTSIGFDISVLELFVPLICGGKVILAENALALPQLPAASEVTLISTVPSVMAELLEQGGVPLSVRSVILGGETLPHPLARRVYQQETIQRLYNLYGPTETTVYSTWALVPPGAPEPPTIGRPIANTRVYVLDGNLQPVPVGVPGELYISGAGLARGYLNRPELTAERFIPNPFGDRGDRLYRTGDLVRWLPSGELDSLGRLDHQVKVRGFRIEPGEVESVLGQHPGVRQAAVVARGDTPESKRLVAYLTDPAPTPQELRAFLKGKLPEYMVPSAFVALDALPLSPNGKIDRQALAAIEETRPELQADFIAPRTPVEEEVAAIWASVLGLDRVGVHDNFFDVGGHSLLATQVISRLAKVFQVELPLRRLFEIPTVAGLAETVEVARLAGEALRLPPLQCLPREGPLPLSFAQQRLWFLDRFEPDSPFYNIPAAARLSGDLDKTALERSLQEIVRRHGTLRTTFQAVEGQPVQVVAPALTLPLPVVDLTGLPETDRAEEARRLAREEAQRPFDLTRGPLLRVTLLKLGPREHVVLLVMHHIVSDGWSMGVFFREVAVLYQAFSAGKPSRLPELPVQYADFACWQRDWLKGEVVEKQFTYWKDRLAGAPAALELPTDRPRPAVQTVHGATEPLQLPRELVERLHALSRREGCTLYMILLAAFQTLLQRYSGQEDFCVGTPVAGRTRPEMEGLIGFFVNTLVLRADLSGDPTFAELLGRVRETCLGAYAHQDLPFEMLVEALQPQRDLSRTPLFQVMLILQNAPLPSLELPGLRLNPIEAESGTAKFDLNLALVETDLGLVGNLEYNTDLFNAATARRLLVHFRNLLEGAVANPGCRVSELPLLTADERHQLLTEWNRTEANVPDEGCIHRLFEAQAERTPEAVALVFEDEKVTYQELNRRANQLAHHLRGLGIGPEVLVGICVERSVEMVVGLLGILKAGGAYVPLDPAFPKERIAFMLNDARVPLVLTQESLEANLFGQEARLVHLDTDAEAIRRHSTEDPTGEVATDNLAYILYTSGSTGQPKGVQITHGSVVNFLASMCREPGLTERDTLLAVTTLSFDIAGLEIFLPLTMGARLVLMPREVAQDGKRLAEKLATSAATIMQATPATWQMLLEAGWSGIPGLKILCGGEAMPPDLARQLLGRCASLWNMYGPTETTIWSTVHRVDGRGGPVPIGRPIANTQVYVTDRRWQPVPVGVVGELLIGGAGLTRGYLGRPELTTEKFIPNPFSDTPGSRLYRTGDLARWLPSGELECLGRLDHQVKVRGFRIEPGEIESVLGQHPGVRQAVVVAREETPGDRRLVGYVVAAQDQAPEEQGAKHVADWQSIWDETYAQPRGVNAPALTKDPALNFSGWNSSYTGLPIPEEEMREWLEHTVARIQALRPARVLEIGCGTGLLLFRIAADCAHYTGTDISGQALYSLLWQLPRQPFELPVRLLQRPADDFSGFADGALDAVVLNSVVQYFPDVDYLLKVLAEAVRVVRPGGHIFVGDVRNRALLEAFHASVQLRQASDSLPVEQLVQRVRKKASQERELVIDPAFFPALKGHLPQVGHVEIQLKRGRHRNEMTTFRYDVVLHVGPDELSARKTTWLDYRESELTPMEVRRRLKDERPEILAITGVPNARIPAQAVALVRLDHTRGTVGDLRQAPGEAGVDPEEFWQLGESQAYAIDMRWTPGTVDGRFDVVFRRREVAAVHFPEEAGPRSWRDYVNEPLRGKATQGLALELRGHLKDRLPEYMVPSAFVLLDALPQTPNGKIDRKALPAPDQDRPDGTVAFVAPRTQTEENLARAGAEVLGLEQVGVHDNFFDLGGHSLQAVQFVARISKALGRDVPVKALFLHPTVATLAEALESGGAAPAGPAALDRNGAASSAMPLDEDRLTALAPQLTIERRPMMPLFESGELAPVQAAAIGYLPSALLEYTGLSPRDIIEGWCAGRPVVSGLYETPLGRIGLMLLPRFDSQVYHDPEDLLGVLGQAVLDAGRLGAQMVSLTGLLPSATRYGQTLEEALAGQKAPRITTGHATTTAAVVLSVRGLLAVAGRDLTRERVGFLGLGSVGTAVLRTLLRCLPHPAEISLCDVYNKRDALHELRREVVEELDYRGPVHVLEARGGVPAELYESSLLIGATNVPDILDVDQLAPGTLLVDDSSPHCFRVDRAVRRLHERQDVLFTEGGMLRAPRPLRQVLYVPADLEQIVPTIPAEAIGNYDPQHITGCVLSSLLSARQADLPPTIGLVGPQACLDHYQALERLGFRAALHCEGGTLDEAGVRDFRCRFGRDGNTQGTPR